MTPSVKCKVIRGNNGNFGIVFSVIDREIRTIHDISGDEELVKAISEAINRNDLSPIHIDDVIEDFIG